MQHQTQLNLKIQKSFAENEENSSEGEQENLPQSENGALEAIAKDTVTEHDIPSVLRSDPETLHLFTYIALLEHSINVIVHRAYLIRR